jgi:hypothetical protein
MDICHKQSLCSYHLLLSSICNSLVVIPLQHPLQLLAFVPKSLPCLIFKATSQLFLKATSLLLFLGHFLLLLNHFLAVVPKPLPSYFIDFVPKQLPGCCSLVISLVLFL